MTWTKSTNACTLCRHCEVGQPPLGIHVLAQKTHLLEPVCINENSIIEFIYYQHDKLHPLYSCVWRYITRGNIPDGKMNSPSGRKSVTSKALNYNTGD